MRKSADARPGLFGHVKAQLSRHLMVAIAVALVSGACGSLNPLPNASVDGIEASMAVDGYRFVITILNDTAYGPDAARPGTFGAVAGVGHRCEWRREGPTVSAATQVTGAAGAVVSTGARWAPLQTGTSSVRLGGIPAAAVTATTVTVICGLRDDSGDHGVAASFQLRKVGGVYFGEKLSLAAWRG